MAASFGHDADRLSAFLDDELDDAEAAQVARHVASCEGCADELNALRRTRDALRNLPSVTTPLSFMMQTVVLGPGEQHSSQSTQLLALATGATMLLLAAAFVLGGQGAGAVVPPVDAFVVDHVRSVEGGPVVVPVRLDTTATDGG